MKLNFFWRFLLFITPLVSCSPTGNQNTKIESVDGDVVVKNGNSLLWKIEKEGYKTAYIYGTMHIIEKEYYNFTEILTHKILSSEALIMEVGGMPNPLEAYNMMVLKDGKVYDFFTKEQMTKILAFFDQKLNISPEIFHATYPNMKPFFLLQSITQAYFDVENTESYDMNMMQLAGENKIPVLGLETLEEQLSFFDAIPKDEMALMIESSIDNFEEDKKEMQNLQKIYAKQKVNKLIPLMNKQSPEFMKYEDIFLTDRNKAWIPKIKNFMKDYKCFIGVGAAHLFGEKGVLELLKKDGFKVTAIATEKN